MSDLRQQLCRMTTRQLEAWDLAHRNYAELKKIRSKRLEFDGFSMVVQFNPERTRSTTAPVEKAMTRPCFLCGKNRPGEQESILWKDYEILLNPYPIFDRHLTIPHQNHILQHLAGHLTDMVILSETLAGFVVAFNGSRSGASAPDHFHFQAVTKGSVPVEREIPQWKNRETLFQRVETSVWSAEGSLRRTIVVESPRPEECIAAAEDVFSCLSGIAPEEGEAQVNALAWVEAGVYRMVFFPRTAHRPAEYYADGKEQFLFSPGAVDMAGVIITVREEDFERASPDLLSGMFAQLVPDARQWSHMKNQLRQCL